MAKLVKKKVVEKSSEPVNFLRKLLSSISHKTGLSFGINENCRLIKIDNTERKREGEIVKKNTYLTFGQFNSEEKLIAQTEFSYFNLDPASEYTFENLVAQLSQLTNLAKVITGEDQTIDPVSSFKSELELSKALKDSKGCKSIQNEMYEQFETIVVDFVGAESTLLRLKVITDKTGKYLQLPKDATFVETMDIPCSLKVTPYELKQQQKSLEAPTATADTIGKAPEKATSKKAILNI
jgi:hypothetical protein